ncbi:ABC transporter ATP-binding protein [Alicyclobacillus cycloheptanicus]|uniref:Oligopeptide/dipeptide ABC transporter ATP-binding protein n=1 Tax=Alicyclobacillus cycloheptanicus TaxID=1457 RepID=A0ABT9XI63_9BACL|nr:ABC transporter ATP-binding protein [Alicyclobacillus cycloheptanicus]MDQ0189887.1 oligopeptide/dipeptide ABC transporter ATP-binding protein [Alicyclobacillus cycloheptanicus]WDM02208.1 ABC transporter ATP-binding protein [Alicyclobacillus cycloheptanicus]
MIPAKVEYETPLLEVRDLKKYYPVSSPLGRGQVVKAVDGISFSVPQGTTLGLVGESGCGKSTVGRSVLNLQPPTSGAVRFQGRDILSTSRKEWRALRREMQIVFQDPFSSLNGRKRIRTLLEEPFHIHGMGTGTLQQELDTLLDLVGLPKNSLNKFPHEFSGGQRQRIVIARAIALRPKFIVCDEPVSALDVSVQSQIVNLFRRLQRELGLTYLFISHDLSVVHHISDHIGVMYLGKMVELSTNDNIYTRPAHPYTLALLSSVPLPDPVEQRSRAKIILTGDLPSPMNPPSGCRFHTRCPFAEARCSVEEPSWREIRKDHWVACHFPKMASDGGGQHVPSA